MATKIKNLNDAIVDKVSSILNNADRIQNLHISIDAEVGEAPLIIYKISELIGEKPEEIE